MAARRRRHELAHYSDHRGRTGRDHDAPRRPAEGRTARRANPPDDGRARRAGDPHRRGRVGDVAPIGRPGRMEYRSRMSPLRRAASACASRPNATAPAVAYTRVLKFPHASVEAGYMRLRTASGALLAVALLVGTAGAQGNAALQAQIQTLIG